jgi:hypothetical protein
VEVGRPEKVLEGLRLVFVELPKYRESRPQEARKLRGAWLKFLKKSVAAQRLAISLSLNAAGAIATFPGEAAHWYGQRQPPKHRNTETR